MKCPVMWLLPYSCRAVWITALLILVLDLLRATAVVSTKS